MNKLVVTTLEAGLKVYDLRCVCVCSMMFGLRVACASRGKKDLLLIPPTSTCLSCHVCCRTQHPKEGFACLEQKAHGGSTVWLARHTPQACTIDFRWIDWWMDGFGLVPACMACLTARQSTDATPVYDHKYRTGTCL